MSTFTKNFPQIILLILMTLFLSNLIPAQDILINFDLVPGQNPTLKVRGEILNDEKFSGGNISFLQDYADAPDLSERIEDLQVFNQRSQQLSLKKTNKNWFLPSAEVKIFSYQVNLSPPENKMTMAHISWIGRDQGLLMLNDLLPEFKGEKISARIILNTPAGWKVSTTEKNTDNFTFEVDNLSDAVFYIGKNQRELQTFLDRSQFGFITSDTWLFRDAVALRMAKTILADYKKIFGKINFRAVNVYLVRLPPEIGFNRWRAETRGSSVIILSSSLPSKSQAIQRIHEQLRHELFHLWVPNSLNLNGDYAWFYEGFSIYQALRTGVKLRQIRFVDFLNTVSQAYNQVNRVERSYSLIDISENRWRDPTASLYSKGLLVAFLCDLSLIKKSDGKEDIEKVFVSLFKKHDKTARPKNANESILKVLEDKGELKDIIEKYIKGTERINLPELLTPFGIKNAGTSASIVFRPEENLSKKDKAILTKLGYN